MYEQSFFWKPDMRKSVRKSGLFIQKKSCRAQLRTSRGYSDERITDMIRSQSPRTVKENCTRVIDNSSSIEETRRQIGEILL